MTRPTKYAIACHFTARAGDQLARRRARRAALRSATRPAARGDPRARDAACCSAGSGALVSRGVGAPERHRASPGRPARRAAARAWHASQRGWRAARRGRCPGRPPAPGLRAGDRARAAARAPCLSPRARSGSEPRPPARSALRSLGAARRARRRGGVQGQPGEPRRAGARRDRRRGLPRQHVTRQRRNGAAPAAARPAAGRAHPLRRAGAGADGEAGESEAPAFTRRRRREGRPVRQPAARIRDASPDRSSC